MEYVSVIVCHYGLIDDFGETSAGSNPIKRSELIRITLESLFKNTDYPAEIIVVDNGGNPDDTDYFLEKVREGKINTLVRFKNNMHFAHAWNTGAKIATGRFLSFVCNDIEFGPKWLSTCIALLEKYKERKLIATPFISYDKKRNTFEVTDDARFNNRSGSNCNVMRREDFEILGEWPVHKKGGTLWYNNLFRQGYRTVAPATDLALDRGWRMGVNFSIPIEVKKVLLDGTEIHFEMKQ